MKNSKTTIPFIKAISVILITAIFSVSWFSYYVLYTMTKGSRQVTVLVLSLYAFIFYYLASKMDGYRISYFKIRDIVSSNIITVGVSDCVIYIIIWMLSIHRPRILPGVCAFAVQCLAIILWAYLSHVYFFKTHQPHETIIVYDLVEDMEAVIEAYGMEKRYHVIAKKNISEINENIKILEPASTVFLCGIKASDRNQILKYCMNHNKATFVIPNIGDIIMSGSKRMHMFHLPMLRSRSYEQPTEYKFIKRTVDLLLSGVALILLSPIMLVIALCVKSDGGPVLYKQKRLTENGKVFEIVKFRSMIPNAEKYTGAVLSAGEDDPRVTKVGRFIRSCRMDELPQLWNIFVGDMSIVGPRPERPEIAAEIEKELPEFSLRLKAKAGLTGYAQVYGKYNTKPYDKLLMDLMYIASPSIFDDLCIMIATIKILFSKESTEGVEVGQTTTIIQDVVHDGKSEHNI